MWGSAWAIATHAGINPLCLCCCDEQDNPGGRQFDDSPADTGKEHVNVDLLVRPRVTRDEERIAPIAARQHDIIGVIKGRSDSPSTSVPPMFNTGSVHPVLMSSAVAISTVAAKGETANLIDFDDMDLFLLLVASQEDE